jgi:hypothetical protein
MGCGALMGIHPRLPAVERNFGRNGLWKLFRAGDNPKRRAVRLTVWRIKRRGETTIRATFNPLRSTDGFVVCPAAPTPRGARAKIRSDGPLPVWSPTP